MWIAVAVTRLPGGGMPKSAPSWVPVADQRVTTASPSAIYSSTVRRRSGIAASEAASAVAWDSRSIRPPGPAS